jgi:hypothetical protein
LAGRGPSAIPGQSGVAAAAAHAASASATRNPGVSNSSSASFQAWVQQSPQRPLLPHPQQQQQQQSPMCSSSAGFQAWGQQSPQQPLHPYQQQQGQPSSWQCPAADNARQAGSSSSRGWRPSIASRVCGSWRLLSAAASGNVVLLCEVFAEPAWHVEGEVHRIKLWLNLTFHFRCEARADSAAHRCTPETGYTGLLVIQDCFPGYGLYN